jgi:hypothetical protein
MDDDEAEHLSQEAELDWLRRPRDLTEEEFR